MTDNYVKSVITDPESGKLTQEFRYFDSKNSLAVAKARAWAEKEAMASKRVSVYKKVSGINGRYVIPEVGDWNSN